MKIKIYTRKIICIILMMLLLLSTKVCAAGDSFSTTLNIDKEEAKRGDTVTITIGLKDIDIKSGEKGIGAYTAEIKFDDSVLEYSESNGTSKWKEPFYQSKAIASSTKDGEVVNTDQNIGTITFKVKDNANLGETVIYLNNFFGSTAETDISATKNKSVKVTVVDDNNGDDNNGEDNNPGNDGSGSNNNKPNGGNGNAGNNNNKPSSGNDNSNNNKPSDEDNSGITNGDENNKPNENPDTSSEGDNSVKPGELPKTGEKGVIIFAGTIVCSVLAIICLILIRLITLKTKH